MSVEMRALMALYRNHPDTPTSARWGDKAKRAARGQREMLLAWAATQPDYRLLDCRNLGVSSLSWIREHQPPALTKHIHDGEWCAACVEHGRNDVDEERLARALHTRFGCNVECRSLPEGHQPAWTFEVDAAAIAKAYSGGH